MVAEVEQVGIENSYLGKVVRPVLSLIVEQPEDAIFNRVLGLACTPECPQTHIVDARVSTDSYSGERCCTWSMPQASGGWQIHLRALY